VWSVEEVEYHGQAIEVSRCHETDSANWRRSILQSRRVPQVLSAIVEQTKKRQARWKDRMRKISQPRFTIINVSRKDRSGRVYAGVRKSLTVGEQEQGKVDKPTLPDLKCFKSQIANSR
jgi:hypothetical protein